ncbi:DUF58 domain-containing protein [candidate division CSSED10-310 bacterium]|uniref:DUF58 domain-containing protein n=1 Tax=candidate division CSSED10-310 bacterium TaxID=2855610 RepID=A0ABV6YYR1_UNCC1
MNWRILTSIMYRLNRRFTPHGLLVLSVLILSAFIGIDTYRTLAYQVFSLLFALAIISFISSLFFRINISAYRKLPRFGTVGEKLEYSVVLENHGDKVQDGLALIENMTDFRMSKGFTERPVAHSATMPGATNKTPKSRKKLKQGGGRQELKEVAVPRLAPQGVEEIRISIVPTSRGHLSLDNLIVARPDLFNLLKSFFTIRKSQEILILPKRYRLPPLDLPGQRKYQSGGVALAHSVGDSKEFASMRDYRPGDPLRRIHWRSWAKTGKPIVKEFEEEFFVRHALILDTFKHDVSEQIFEEAVSVAASFVCTVQTQESLLDLMFIGPEAYCFTSGRGLNTTDKMLEILAAVEPCQDKPFRSLIALVQSRAAFMSGCVCIFLEWNEDRRELIMLLKNMRIPVQVFVITTQDDLPPEKTIHHQNVHYLEVGRIEQGFRNI